LHKAEGFGFLPTACSFEASVSVFGSFFQNLFYSFRGREISASLVTLEIFFALERAITTVTISAL